MAGDADSRLLKLAGRRSLLAATGLAIALLAGCAANKNRAPVEDRSAAPRPAAAASAPAPPGTASAVPDDGKALPGAENAGKPGYYTVKPGDTLIRIGLETGQNWRDIVRWNALDKPNVIEVGQVLRVVPPGADPSAASSRAVSTAKVETRPLERAPAPSAPPAAASAAPAGSAPNANAVAAAPSAAAPGVSAPGSPASAPPRDSDDDVAWGWPASGAVVQGFDEARSKGLSIAGKAGDPVLAAADGRVVYAGSGLRGYGNLLILKHNNTYLTAYAHNQALLVKEDQAVRKGQRIAEMGSSDAEVVALHFEIRRQGKPIDPAKLLPPR
jgi:lipoprotein NlpD